MIKKYTTDKIQDIIDNGSVKDKATLFLRDRMGYFQNGLSFILNFGDPEILTNSVSPQDQSQWNEYISWGLRIENAFRDLNRFRMSAHQYREEMSRTASILLDMEEMEEMTTELLLMVGKNTKLHPKEDGNLINNLRRANGEWVLMGRQFSHIDPKITTDGTIDLHLSKRGEEDNFPTLRDRMTQEYERAKEWMMRFLLFVEAMRRRFKQMEIVLPEYEQLISAYMETLDKPFAGFLRFQGVQENRLFHLGQYTKKGEIPYPAMRDLIEDYSINISEIDPQIEKHEELIITYYKSI
jgi:hypothetical protein